MRQDGGRVINGSARLREALRESHKQESVSTWDYIWRKFAIKEIR